MSAPVEKTKAAPTRPVGPDYRSESQKPAATVSTGVEFETVTVLPQTPQLIALLTCVLSIVYPVLWYLGPTCTAFMQIGFLIQTTMKLTQFSCMQNHP